MDVRGLGLGASAWRTMRGWERDKCAVGSGAPRLVNLQRRLHIKYLAHPFASLRLRGSFTATKSVLNIIYQLFHIISAIEMD